MSCCRHDPVSAQPQPAQTSDYYDPLQSIPPLDLYQSATYDGITNPNPFATQILPGLHRSAPPSLDLGVPSSRSQAVPDFGYSRSPPVPQAGYPTAQMQTPTVGPSHVVPNSSPDEGNMLYLPRGRKMKHLTCYYWAKYENCRFSEEDCIYSHHYEGCERIASKPIHKEPGMPAVAGHNAMKDNPNYINWKLVNAAFDPPRPKSPLHPKIQAQIENIRKKHVPEYSKDPQIKILQQAEQRAIEMRKIDAVGAAAHHARLDARIKALEEVIERLGGDKTLSESQTTTTSSTAPTTRTSSDPITSPPAIKEAKLNIDTSKTPNIDTSKVMTDLVAENQALRSAIQDMAQVVSTAMASNATIRARRHQLHDSLFMKILKLPEEWHDLLLKPFSTSTQGFQDTRDDEERARMLMYAIRAKLVEIGHGGLLTSWDRDFCRSTPRPHEDEV
ncbi:MAG: hypothetical protein Q9213_006338 [Squamulea squamosa]